MNNDKTNICWDCRRACGACSWSGLDPRTGKPMFRPVPGWTAEYIQLGDYVPKGGQPIMTYHITACPKFKRDPPRRSIYPMEGEPAGKDMRELLDKWAAIRAAYRKMRWRKDNAEL